MVEGLTADTDLVLDGDDDGDGGNQDQPEPPAKPIPPGQSGAQLIDIHHTDRSEYDIERQDGDPFGNPTSIKYGDGNTVDFKYDDDGNLTGINDTASGISFDKDGDRWIVTGKDGSKTALEGDVSVDPQNGAIVAKLDNGTTITTFPDGRSVATDENGNLVGVNNPNYREGTNDHYLNVPAGGSATYDDNGNIVRATDAMGNRYQQTASGQWVEFDIQGNMKPIEGTVRIDPYRGVYVEPSGGQNVSR
jgi:YD repeat-containing protein